MAKILIVDDEPSMLRILTVILADAKHSVTASGGLNEARAALAKERFDRGMFIEIEINFEEVECDRRRDHHHHRSKPETIRG